MKTIAAFVVLSFLILGATAQQLVFSDDFNEFNLEKWEHEITAGGGGNWEFEWYTNNRTNSFVRDGILYLMPTLTKDNLGEQGLTSTGSLDLWGSQPADMCTGNAFYGCSRQAGAGGNILNPIQSARLRTSTSLNFKYGKIEIRAKLPVGDWIWPAIWMLPRYNSYGQWPASGEIDIMESRGNLNYPLGGAESFGSTLHVGPSWMLDDWPNYHGEFKLPKGTLGDDFHVYGMEWTENEMYTYLDDPTQKVLHVKFNVSAWERGNFGKKGYQVNPWAGRGNNAPFDQKFYLIFNVAVGGTSDYFKDGVGGKPWTNTDQHSANTFWNSRGQWQPTWVGEKVAMQIDWVKVWQ